MLRAVQQVLRDALGSNHPAETLRQQVEAAHGLSDQERAWLRQIDSDGLILTAMLVKKLRFERLTHGDTALMDFFDQQFDQFMHEYREYTATVPPMAYFPDHEANLYRQWQARRAASSQGC